MAEFVTNPHRRDPYKNFKFRISIDGKIVAAVSEVTGLNPAPGSSKKKSKKKMPGLQKFGNITLKRGIAADKKLLDWANNLSNSSDTLSGLRKNMMVEFCNEAGEVIGSYRIINAWPTKLVAPSLSAGGNEIAIETMELSYEGLEQIRG